MVEVSAADVDHKHLRDAIRRSADNVAVGGGPFGAIVVKAGAVIGRGTNRVTVDLDPTAHAEMVAIRDACRAIGDFRLVGATLYSSCEPCPMCLAAAYWARIDRVVFAATRADASEAGFDDSILYDELSLPHDQRRLLCVPDGTLREMARAALLAWREKADHTAY